MLKVFILVLIVAGGLRFTALTFDSLWLDEGYQTVVESYGNALPDFFQSSGKAFIYKSQNPNSVKNVLAQFRKVDPLCPPLYAVIMNRWLTIFGGSDFALRAFSAACSMLSIIGIYYFGNLLLGRRAALFASLIQTISPFDISYAQEARMYSLCTLLAILSGGSLLYFCLKRNSPKNIIFAVVYTLSTWALINTHYTLLFLWAFAIFIGTTIAILRKDQLLAAYVLITNICIVALSVPWIPLFLQATSIHTASFYVMRPPSLFWPIWAFLMRIPFNWLVFLSGKKVMLWAAPVYATSSVLLLSALPTLIGFLKMAKTKIRDGQTLTNPTINFSIFLLFLWALLPATMIWFLDVVESHRIVEISRYLIGTAPAIYLLAGYALSTVSIKRVLLPLAITHAIFCLSNNAYLHIVPQKENWRQIAQFIELKIKPQEPLFISNYYNILCLDRYLLKPLKQIGLSTGLGSNLIENTIENNLQLNGCKTFWLLTAQEGDAIFHDIPLAYAIVQHYDFPHALHLRQYQAK